MIKIHKLCSNNEQSYVPELKHSNNKVNIQNEFNDTTVIKSPINRMKMKKMILDNTSNNIRIENEVMTPNGNIVCQMNSLRELIPNSNVSLVLPQVKNNSMDVNKYSKKQQQKLKIINQIQKKKKEYLKNLSTDTKQKYGQINEMSLDNYHLINSSNNYLNSILKNFNSGNIQNQNCNNQSIIYQQPQSVNYQPQQQQQQSMNSPNICMVRKLVANVKSTNEKIRMLEKQQESKEQMIIRTLDLDDKDDKFRCIQKSSLGLSNDSGLVNKNMLRVSELMDIQIKRNIDFKQIYRMKLGQSMHQNIVNYKF